MIENLYIKLNNFNSFSLKYFTILNILQNILHFSFYIYFRYALSLIKTLKCLSLSLIRNDNFFFKKIFTKY